MMKDLETGLMTVIIIILIIFGAAIASIIGLNDKYKNTKQSYKELTESYDSCVVVNNKLTISYDSLYVKYDSILLVNANYKSTDTYVIDSLYTELMSAKAKLERIKYYNDIAKKGNNIIYLRGWINRTLNN